MGSSRLTGARCRISGELSGDAPDALGEGGETDGEIGDAGKIGDAGETGEDGELPGE